MIKLNRLEFPYLSDHSMAFECCLSKYIKFRITPQQGSSLCITPLCLLSMPVENYTTAEIILMILHSPHDNHLLVDSGYLCSRRQSLPPRPSFAHPGKKKKDLAKLSDGLDKSPTYMVGETKQQKTT